MNLYRVSVFNATEGLAVWERFGESEAHVIETTFKAAQAEWPAATDLEVFVNCRVPYAGRMGCDEYFWNYEFRFDLRDATRGEQEAVRTILLAQRLELNGYTPRHIEIVELVLGRESVARKMDDGHYVDAALEAG